jgi:hypothetical protein
LCATFNLSVTIPDAGRFSASRALGLDVPPSLLARADEVIE